MADSSGGRQKLSKGILQMKFMQRSAIKLEKEAADLEQQHVIDDEHWVLDLPDQNKTKKSKYQLESSLAIIESLNWGRMSFQGMNPEIERLQKVYEAGSMGKKVEKESRKHKEKEDEPDGIDEDEMVRRYKNLIGTISKKFATKQKKEKVAKFLAEAEGDPTPQKKKKKKFLRPADDEVE